MADVARGERIRRLREDRHLSQEAAAHRIGVSVKSLRSWEKGGRIKWANAKRAAEEFEVSPESLVSREPVPELPDGPGELDEKLEELRAGQARLLSEMAALHDELQAWRELQRPHAPSSAGSGND